MAEFGIRATNLQGPSFAGSNPVAPVQRAGRSPAIPESLIRTGFALAGSIQEAHKADAEAEANRVFNNYQKSLAGIAQSRDAGNVSDAEANARVRAISAKYLAEGGGGDPKYAETLKKIRDSVFGITSLGEAEETEKIERDLRKSQLEEARKRGLISGISGLTPEIENQADALVAAMMRAEDEFNSLQNSAQATRAEETHTMAVGRYNMDIGNYTREQAVRNAGQDMVNQAITFSDSVFQKVTNEINAGSLDFISGQQQVASLMAKFKGQIGALVQDDPRTASLLGTLMSDLESAWVQANDPATRSSQTTNLWNEQLARWKLLATQQSPELREVTVMSALAPHVPILQGKSSAVIADTIGKLSLPHTALGIIGNSDIAAENGFYQSVGATVRAADTGQASDPQKNYSDAALAVNKTFQDMASNYNLAMNDPTKFRDVTKFIAGPEVAKLINNSLLDPIYMNQAKDAWKSSYEESVKRGVTRLLNQPVGLSQGSVVGPTRPAPNLSTLIDFRFSNNGLEIISKQGSQPIASPQFLRQQEANVKKFTEAFNLIIKAGAHLEGTTNYQEYFDRNKHVLMPDFYPTPEEEVEYRGRGYQGGNALNPANWRSVNANRE